MRYRLTTTLACGVVAVLSTQPLLAQQGTSVSHQMSSHLAQRPKPKIIADSARVLARATVPNGKITSSELEREHGKLIYSFDIKVAGKSGIEEVHVDALTGKVIAHEHESPKAERQEAAQEAHKPVHKQP